MKVETFEGISVADAMRSVKKAFGSEAVILETVEQPIPGKKGATSVLVKAAVAEPGGRGDLNPSSRIMPPARSEPRSEVEFKNLDLLPAMAQSIQELRSLMFSSFSAQMPFAEGLSSDKIELLNLLRTRGLSDTVLTQLVKEVLAGDFEGPRKPKEMVAQWLYKHTRIIPNSELVSEDTTFHLFVGPTGGGKSTFVAKLAGYLAKNHGTKVTILSFDNKRIAAGDQMRVYAKLLGVDFESMSSPESLKAAYLKRRNTGAVLIDTAGMTPKSIDDLADLLLLKKQGMFIRSHLVLPVTSDANFIDKQVSSFSPCGLSSLIFTKLDESWRCGDIFNLNLSWSIPLSFFSVGQDIPDSIERATKERVVERIIGHV